jgi:hypothetical protein
MMLKRSQGVQIISSIEDELAIIALTRTKRFVDIII